MLKYEVWYRTAEYNFGNCGICEKSIVHRVNGQMHRLNGPAIIWGDGDLVWIRYDEYISIRNCYWCR